MNIPEIASLKTAIEMRREVLRTAIEKNLPEEDVWRELESYRNKIKGKTPLHISSILLCNILYSPSGLAKTITGKEIKVVDSPIEELLDFHLNKTKLEYRQQEKIGKYRVDFFFPKSNLIVEIDGREYHSSTEQRQKDFERELALIKKGYTVLRFTGSQVYKDTQGCVDKIYKFLEGHLNG